MARCMALADTGRDVALLILRLRLAPEVHPWVLVEFYVREYLGLVEVANPERSGPAPRDTSVAQVESELSPQPPGISTTLVTRVVAPALV